MMKQSNSAVDSAADESVGGGGFFTTYVDSKKLGPHTPVRRSKRNAAADAPPFGPYRTTVSRSTNTDGPTFATVATSTNTNTNGDDLEDDGQDNDDDLDDLCAIFQTKVRVVEKDDGSGGPSSTLLRAVVGTPTRVTPLPRAGRYTDLVVDTKNTKKGKRKAAGGTNSAAISAAIGPFSPVRRCTRNA